MKDLRTVAADQHPFFPATRRGGVYTMSLVSGELRIIATTTDGWDHVSVSLADRCPTWAELEVVKRTFFCDDETAMQLHVPPADHINNSPYCLHLWRPQQATIPRPPGWMVGVKGRTPEQTAALGLGVFHDQRRGA